MTKIFLQLAALQWILLVISPVAFAFCVNVSKAKLRSGPGTKYPVSWVVGRYMPLLEVSRKGSWVQVADLEGEKHWIFRQSITNKFQCLVIKGTYAHLRTGPGGQFPLAEMNLADRYMPFRRFDFQEGWYGIEDANGAKAWVHESLIWRPVKVMKINF